MKTKHKTRIEKQNADRYNYVYIFLLKINLTDGYSYINS
jgi:hypothetical protein